MIKNVQKFNSEINFNDLIGSKTILYGETDTKKTYFTSKFVKFLLENINFEPKLITILDFAPPLYFLNNIKVGGKLEDYYKRCKLCNLINLKSEIIPPRLKATNKAELYKNLCHNYKLTSNAFKEFEKKPTPVLIINDISIYLHLGDIDYLLEAINKTETFFGNSYYGFKIKKRFARLLSKKEKKRVELIIENIQNSFFTG